ncbi:MAG: hypothetical protein JSS07_01140 [Proteobacteria bacterium]|nr:hypothetical protein [Pseudomonadota bacterium]
MDILTLLLWLSAILGLVAFFRLAAIIERISALEAKVNELLTIIAKSQASPEVQPQAAEPSHQIEKPVEPSEPTTWPETPQTKQITTVEAPSNTYLIWIKENWAGFLGVSILVLGITFAGVYISFFATAFIRFLMIIGMGILLLIASRFLRQKMVWQELAAWLQSASGAIILFAMIGSSAFSTLRFYHEPVLGLLLLIMGLIYNLVLAYYAPKQIQASLHVLISLLALLIVPKDLMLFAVAVLITLAGVGLSLKHTWNINLIISYVAFTIFHYYWLQFQTATAMTALVGISGISLVGVSALLVHYRKTYQSIEATKNLFTHVSIWVLFGTQLILYNVGFKYIFIPLGLTAMASFAFSFYARRQQMEWLFICDTLVGQLLILLAIISLVRIEFQQEFIPWIATIESLAFTTLCHQRAQKLLSCIGIWLTYACYIVFCFTLVILDKTQQILVLGIATIIPFYLLRWYFAKNELETTYSDNKLSVQGFPVLLDIVVFVTAAFVLCLALVHYQGGYLSFVVVIYLMTFNSAVMDKQDHRFFYHLFILFTILYGTGCVIRFDVQLLSSFLLYFLPTVVLLLGLIQRKTFLLKNNKVNFEDVAIYLLGFHIALFVFVKLWILSSYLPGVCYLAAAILFFELGYFCNQTSKSRLFLLGAACKNMALLFLFGFMILYVLGYLQSEASIAGISLKTILSIIVITICAYWYYTPPFNAQLYPVLSNKASVKMLPFTQAIPFDMGLFTAILLLVSNFSAPIHPIGYGILALLLSVPFTRTIVPLRAHVYAVILLFALCIQVAVVSSKWASPLSDWYQNTHITGPISFILALGIIAFLLQKPDNSDQNRLLKIFYKNPVLIGYIPLFTAVALFLLWRFDKAYLTMLWVVEVLLMVIVGYYLRNKYLVHIALVFLIFCVARLIFYDLAQTDLLVRAVVFVVVGLLMIFIHMIYKKYAGRLL